MTIALSETPIITGNHELAALQTRWRRQLNELAHPAVEMTVETIAPFIGTYQALRKAGETLDAALVVVMGKLVQQMRDERRDSCVDGGVDAADFENEDPDEDKDMSDWEPS